jgi:hypothetical protein
MIGSLDIPPVVFVTKRGALPWQTLRRALVLLALGTLGIALITQTTAAVRLTPWIGGAATALMGLIVAFGTALIPSSPKPNRHGPPLRAGDK